MDFKPMTPSRQVLANLGSDLYIKARILESAAGKPRGTWSKHDVFATRRALALAKSELLDADPSWFEIKDHGIYRVMVSAASMVLSSRGDTSRSAEAVVSELILSSRTSDSLGSLGKKLSEKIVSGELGVDKIKRPLSAWA